MGRFFLNSDRGVGFLEVLSLFLLLAFGAFVFYGYCQEERITLTTYYPAPFGIYRDLNVTRTLNITSASAAAPTNGIYFQRPAGGAFIRGYATVLRLDVFPSGTNSVFIGAYNNSGMQIYDSGDVRVTARMSVAGNFSSGGELLSYSSGFGHGCLVLSYGSNSGVTSCPSGFTLNIGLSGAALITGGVFYCCK